MAERYLYIECGSVLTKCLVIQTGSSLTVLARGEAPTTAGYAGDDVFLGILASVREAEEMYGKNLVNETPPLSLAPDSGIKQIIVSTSIAGGALAAVGGVFRDISAESAQRALLLAGASVSDVFSVNDSRLPHEKRVALKQRPIDFLILAGGVDDPGNNKTPGVQAVGVARLLSAGLPHSRSIPDERPTVIYAGSMQVREDITEVFEGVAPLLITENVRPTIETEDLSAARDTILEAFHRLTDKSPRYKNVGHIVSPAGYHLVHALQEMTRFSQSNILVLDLGGAHLETYSTIGKVLNRTVVDLSRSAVNSGEALKWIPFKFSRAEIGAAYGNRLLHPGSVPETWEELVVKMALCREEARASLEHHKRMAVSLRGIQRKRQIWEVFSQSQNVGGQSLIDISRIRHIVLTGRWLSHYSPAQMAAIAMEGLGTAGMNTIYADKHGILPALGALLLRSELHPDDVLSKILSLGTVFSPIETHARSRLPFMSSALATARIETGAERHSLALMPGRIHRWDLPAGRSATVTITPSSNVDFGEGPGKKVSGEATGGELGLLFDMRPRPLSIPSDENRRRARLIEWWSELGVFPDEVLRSWERSEAHD